MTTWNPSGSQRVTGDLAVGASGQPIIVWAVTLVSGTSPTITLRNGPAVTDTAFTAALTANTNWPAGLFFPAGCFADVDGTSPVWVVSYTQAATA